MGVEQSRRELGVAEESLDRPEADTILQELRRQRVSQGVEPHPLRDARPPARPVERGLDRLRREGPAPHLPLEEPRGRPVSAPVLPEGGEQAAREHDVPVSPALASLDPVHHALRIDVLGTEREGFGKAEAAAVCRHEDGPVLEVRAGREERPHLGGAEDLRKHPGMSLERDARESQSRSRQSR
jgi:hypothetical protein